MAAGMSNFKKKLSCNYDILIQNYNITLLNYDICQRFDILCQSYYINMSKLGCSMS